MMSNHSPNKWGLPKIRGTVLGGPHNKDYSILGSILGSPYLGKLPNGVKFAFLTSVRSQGEPDARAGTREAPLEPW